MSVEASIVILCHNDDHYLFNCVKSVFRHTRDVRYELILVDNDSKDNAARTMTRIKRLNRCPVKIIRSDRNLFFAGGNYLGLQAAKGRYVMFLNADTLVTEGWLRRMIDAMEADRSLGLVGPMTNSAVGPQVVKPRYSLSGLDKWAARFTAACRHEPVAVPWMIGFCVLMKREFALKLEGFDRAYGPGGYEDYDLCLNTRFAGLEVAVIPGSYVHHFGGKGYVGMNYNAMRSTNQVAYWGKWCRKTAERLNDIF